MMWLVVFFLATMLLAAGTLLDGELHVGRALVGKEMVQKESIAVTSTGWTPWSRLLDNNHTSRSANTVYPEQTIHPKLRPSSPTSVSKDKHGLYIIDPLEEKKLCFHPITMLIKEAQRKAELMDAKIQSIQSFEDAVNDYRRAFGIDPPRGFKHW